MDKLNLVATKSWAGRILTLPSEFYRQIIILWLILMLIDFSMSHWLILVIHKGWFSEVNPLISLTMPFLDYYTFVVWGFATVVVATVVWFLKNKYTTRVMCFLLLVEVAVVVNQSILLMTFYWG